MKHQEYLAGGGHWVCGSETIQGRNSIDVVLISEYRAAHTLWNETLQQMAIKSKEVFFPIEPISVLTPSSGCRGSKTLSEGSAAWNAD